MKIRTLLLGSAALAGLTTAGYAADLGVVTSLDVCDELGLTGLTISSDDNCLVVTGGVTFEYDWGNYAPSPVYGNYSWAPGTNTFTVLDPIGQTDSNSGDVDTWIKFAASASSDFGPATATIKLMANNVSGTGNWNGPVTTGAGQTAGGGIDRGVGLGEAWVGVGDTTQLMAGYKGSIFNSGDDLPLNYLGLFNSSSITTPGNGVGFAASAGAATGGDVIQVVSNLGNGLTASGGIEKLSQPFGEATLVGVLAYAGDGITAHISAADSGGVGGGWKIHAGFTGAWDPIQVVGAFAADNTGYWDALGSVAANFDMFTLALSGEATSGQQNALGDEYGAGASLKAKISDSVTLNLGGRYFHGVVGGAYNLYQAEAGLSAAITDTLTLTGAVGVINSSIVGNVGTVFYGTGGVNWAPGGGFTSSASLQVNNLGGYEAIFKAAKTIK